MCPSDLRLASIADRFRERRSIAFGVRSGRFDEKDSTGMVVMSTGTRSPKTGLPNRDMAESSPVAITAFKPPRLGRPADRAVLRRRGRSPDRPSSRPTERAPRTGPVRGERRGVSMAVARGSTAGYERHVEADMAPAACWRSGPAATRSRGAVTLEELRRRTRSPTPGGLRALAARAA